MGLKSSQLCVVKHNIFHFDDYWENMFVPRCQTAIFVSITVSMLGKKDKSYFGDGLGVFFDCVPAN